MNTRTFDLPDELTFGKYCEAPLEKVIWDDPEYIEWAYHNIGWFELSEEAIEELEFAKAGRGL